MNLLFLLFLFGALLALGLFFVLASLLKLPAVRAQRAVANSGKSRKKASGSIEAHLISIAVRLSKFVRMDEYKKSRMQYTLTAAGLNMTPDVYTAYAFTKAGAILLAIIPCLLILPLISPVILFLSVMVYFREIRRADERLKEKRDEIESELPRFVATIEQALKNSRDVLSIVENFKKNAGEALAGELAVLTADMRSSNYEAALTRFEARINSPQVSDIVRGLISVLRGDDSAVYFQMLSHDMKQLELQRLNKRAQKIPPKIRVFSLVMLLCFLLTYLAVIAVQVMQSLSGMF